MARQLSFGGEEVSISDNEEQISFSKLFFLAKIDTLTNLFVWFFRYCGIIRRTKIESSTCSAYFKNLSRERTFLEKGFWQTNW